jgi:stage II sporulation protein E
MTVSILTKLLKSGLGENCALQVVNSALMVKSEDESLSTVDMVKLDLFDGSVTLNKAGAPFTYIKKGGRLLKKSAKSLPVGILGDVKFASDSVKLKGGDVIVMVSDGATLKDEKWLEDLIKSFKENDACADLAKAVVNEAIKRRSDGHDDDITAVAIKISET